MIKRLTCRFAFFLALVVSTQASARCLNFVHAPALGPNATAIQNQCERCITAPVTLCNGRVLTVTAQPRAIAPWPSCIGTQTIGIETNCGGASVGRTVGGTAKSNIEVDTASNTKITEGEIASQSKSSMVWTMSDGRIETKSLGTAAQVGSSCSARNGRGDSCSITCPIGQSAQCQNASDAASPRCECK